MTWHDTGLAIDGGAQMRHCEVSGLRLLVASVDDEWLAVSDRCSHAECAFSEDGEVDGVVVICNCHGSEFDLRTGAVLVGPAREPIRSFPVRLVGARLEVEL